VTTTLEFDPAVYPGRFQATIPPPADRSSFFVFGVHRSGSSLLNRIFHLLCDRADVPDFSLPDQLFRAGVGDDVLAGCTNLQAVIRDGYCVRGFRTFPAPLRTHTLLRPRKKILLVRDPRDALVSMYYSRALGSHTDAGPGRARWKQIAHRREHRHKTIDDYVVDVCAEIRESLIGYRRGLEGLEHLKIYRYEDVISEKRSWIEDMTTFVHLPVEADDLDEVAKLVDVWPETEQPAHHIRQVTPGDHRAKLAPSTVERLTAELRAELLAFGYPTT